LFDASILPNCIFTSELVIKQQSQAGQMVKRLMFNFIRTFGVSISGHASISQLKLDELNVRKCINLELNSRGTCLNLLQTTQEVLSQSKDWEIEGDILYTTMLLSPIILQISNTQSLTIE
jgi:hypothetical protein